jgi:hypothetical protein
VIALVSTVDGVFSVDLESGEVSAADAFSAASEPVLNLPRVVAAAAAGATVVAAVDAKPPLLVSYDAGMTWREAGRGLPSARAVAVCGDDPDTIVYASRNRLYLSRNGGVFWSAVTGELPEIQAVAV